jgi:hypothetical protein
MKKRVPRPSSLERRLSRVIGKPLSSGTWMVAPSALGLEGCFQVAETRFWTRGLR